MKRYWIKLLCENCNNIDSMPIETLHEWMGRTNNKINCAYGCLEKSDIRIYSLTEKNL